ncbi:MAG: aldo/keto reductase [Candidatus Zhuqueibacterota bacterium]
METRKLGSNGPALTTIGLGAWAIGGPWAWGWGKQDDAQSIAAIRASIERGINWIDTAAVYGLGHSEEIVARALEGMQQKVFIATKCGLAWDDRKRVRNDLTPQSIRRELEASLKRLKREQIDLYQFHWPDPKTPVEKSWEEMIKFKQEGKVRYLGVSNFDVALMEKCQSLHPIDSLQPPYSLLARGIEKDILPFCETNGIGVIAYSPMFSGLLSGKFDASRLQAGDWRPKIEDFREPKLTRNLEFVEALRPIAAKYQKTVGQLAVAWVLHHPAVTAAIVGARNADQAEENIGGAGFTIAEDDREKIRLLLDELTAH